MLSVLKKTLKLLYCYDQLGFTIPKNIALFIVGKQGLPPQAQLFPAETTQTSMVKGCEKLNYYKAETGTSTLTAKSDKSISRRS